MNSDPGFSTAQLHALISGAPEVMEVTPGQGHSSGHGDPLVWERRSTAIEDRQRGGCLLKNKH